MPRMNNVDDNMMNIGSIPGMQGFAFSAVRTENLGATEYTLVTIAIDETGSTLGFEKELLDCLIASVESCKKSPRSDNLLIRVIVFSDKYEDGFQEIHGFKPLPEIDTKDYQQLSPGGLTPLCDADFSCISATNAYAKILTEDDFQVNGIVFLITDGYENASTTTQNMVAAERKKGVTNEEIESLLTLLIGINAKAYKDVLKEYKDNTGIDKYIDAGEATKSQLAKLAEFVSQSVSSQSQSLGTGGPSQNISATI